MEESKENEYAMRAIMRTVAVGKGSTAGFANEVISGVTAILVGLLWIPINR